MVEHVGENAMVMIVTIPSSYIRMNCEHYLIVDIYHN